MFAARFFGKRYFAQRYFGGAGASAVGFAGSNRFFGDGFTSVVKS